MIEAIKHEDLLLLTEELNGMMTKHIEWLATIHKTIVCNLPPTTSIPPNHHSCDFGKWYYSVTHPELINNKQFKNLEMSHTKLHYIANRILDQYRNKITIYEYEYNMFTEIQTQFFDELRFFVDHVISTKDKFDHLTKIPNRCLTYSILEKYHSRSVKNNSDCYVAFADIDNFKQVNDTYGHMVGDIVLKEVSKYFSENLRTYDTVGRFGGEEFLFCFPNTHMNEVFEILERIRAGVEKISIRINESTSINITCSFGLSLMSRDNSLTDTIKEADDAMYAAKECGKNIIKISSDTVY